MNDPVEILAATPIFQGMPARELEGLRPSLRTRRFDKDRYLFREGDPGSHLFVIVEGEVKISHVGESGAEVVYTIAGPGDVLGELTLFESDAERTADAQALEPTECLVVARGPLIEFLSSRPALLLRIISILSTHIKRKDAALSEVSFLDIPARVALKLLELADTKGRPAGSGTVIGVALNQRTLAGMVGASRENVNRALSRFAELGYIRQVQGRIEVIDRDQLRRRGAPPA
ncbi:MAG TPA: Crp/Fnr family transcriptional regulator [Patescibacteria group bacterium]|nr:Crp/Fnr family transcriptional regulator [Patescibacteria group bacterium]